MRARGGHCSAVLRRRRLTLARRVVLPQCLGELLPLVISEIPGKVVTDVITKFTPVCPKVAFPFAGCLSGAGSSSNPYVFLTNTITCPVGGGTPVCPAATETAKCCNYKDPTVAGFSCSAPASEPNENSPVCKEKTDSSVSITLPSKSGFIAKSCDKTPRGCDVCNYCCSHGFGADEDKVKKCKASVCDAFPIFDKCVMRSRNLLLWLPCRGCGRLRRLVC